MPAVMGAALFLSVAYSFYFQIPSLVDARGYDRIAWNLVQGNGYREDASLSYDADIAILRVGPGYQFFLAALYAVFGHHLAAVWVANAILLALTAGIVYLLARRIFRSSPHRFAIGVVAALFIAFSPDLITIAGMVMTETLGVFLVALSALCFFWYLDLRDENTRWLVSRGALVLAAAVFAYAVMVRTPAALLFLPFLYVWFRRRRFADMAVFVAVAVLIFTPWIARNYAIYHAFIPTNLAFGYDLLAGNHIGATGEFEPFKLNEKLVTDYGRIEGNTVALREAFAFIAAHPIEFLKLTANRISIYFSIARPTGFWFHLQGWERALTLALSAFYSAILFFFGFLGIYKMFRLDPENRARAGFLAALFLMMPLSIIFIIVETRYRFLSYPFLAVFAGFAIASGFRRSEWRGVIAIAVLLISNSFVDALRNLDRVYERLAGLFL